MSLRYESTVDITATPERVWGVLTDTQWYDSGDNGVIRVEGSIEVGEKLTIYSEVNPGRAFPAEVRELTPAERMVWGWSMPLGLFTGERVFSLEPIDGGTRLVMWEEFGGPLLPLIGRTMPDLQPSFDHFASGLKKSAEAEIA